MATAVSSLCREGLIVVIDEFQVCCSGPLSGLPSLLKQRVDSLLDEDAAGGLIVMGSVQTEMEDLMLHLRAPLYGRTTFNMTLAP